MNNQIMQFVWFVLIGAVAGWLAGRIMKGSGFGLVNNIVVGVLGAVLGGWLFGALGISSGGGTITAVAGAVILLFLITIFNRKN